MIDTLFTFRGRMRRRDFIIFECVAVFINVYLFFDSFVSESGLIIILLLFLLSIINFFQVIKRLHDINQSGLFALFMFTPLFPIIFIYLFIKGGDDGDNQYGVDPKKAEV